MIINRPPKDLDAFIGRKWLESLTKNAGEIDDLFNSPFLVVNATATLSGSRSLAVNSTLTKTDGGAQSSLTLGVNLANANTWTQPQSVPDDAYGVSWNGSAVVPTKNALYDKIEAVTAGTSDIDKLLHLGY